MNPCIDKLPIRWPLSPAELERMVRQALDSQRLEGLPISPGVFERALEDLRRLSAEDVNAIIAQAEAHVGRVEENVCKYDS